MPVLLPAAPAAVPEPVRSVSPPAPGVPKHIPVHPAFLLRRPQPFPLAGPQGTAPCPHVLPFSLHGVGCSAAGRGGGRTGASQARNHPRDDPWLTLMYLRRPQLCPLQTSLTNPPKLCENLWLWLKPGAITAKPWVRCERPRLKSRCDF